MSRYIDAEKLYDRFAELEAQAMEQIEKLNRIPFEEMTKKRIYRMACMVGNFERKNGF